MSAALLHVNVEKLFVVISVEMVDSAISISTDARLLLIVAEVLSGVSPFVSFEVRKNV